MASIVSVDKPILTKGTHGDNTWSVTIKYKIHFNSFDLNLGKLGMLFWDGARLKESDSTSDDDRIGGWHSPTGKFSPTVADVSRTVTFTVSESDLDTEWGEEELYARVKLRNVSLDTPGIFKNSNQLPLDI